MTIPVTEQERAELCEQAAIRSQGNTELYNHLAALAQDQEAKMKVEWKRRADDGYLDWDYKNCGSFKNYEWGN